MLHRKRMLVVVWLAMLCLAHCIPSQPLLKPCECGLYLRDELWRPKFQALVLVNDLKMDCSNTGGAVEQCKDYCSNEMVALALLFKRDPILLRDYPPTQNLPCDLLPRETVSFSKVCGNSHYILSSRALGPRVCCDSNTTKPIWCETSEGIADDDNLVQGRKLDLTKEENDESHNEIEDATASSVPPKSKPSRVPVSSSSSPSSWIATTIKFLGYDSIGDFVRNIDVFSLPGKFQKAIKAYRDEVSMGRCYMEFTTFKVFTRQENPFEDLIRKKRDSASPENGEPVTRFDEFFSSAEVESQTARTQDPAITARLASVQRIAGTLQGMLGAYESTRQYADLINTFLPVITKVIAGGGGEAGSMSPLSLLLKYGGPLLYQMASSRPSTTSNTPANTNNSGHIKPENPPGSPASNLADSPMASLAMNLIGSFVSNLLNSRVVENKVGSEPVHTTSTTTTTTTTPPHIRPVASAAVGGGAQPQLEFLATVINTLMKTFLQNRPGAASAQDARPIESPKPAAPHPNQVKDLEKKEPKSFIDMLLELIRPVFISIIGNAPGESGVEAIRRVSTLSTLGRVDDTLKEEVDSPYFCLKKYMVNKAWSLTETGVRSIVSKFTPEEQARMMRKLLS